MTATGVEHIRTGAGATAGSFRPDVQGLRAVAVLLVVLYHARLPGLSGGYVGVDVFFVISGFLITQLLARELTTTGRIAFGQFYARRVRRILPASFLVLAVTAVVGMAVMSPLRTAGFLRTVAATAFYASNILFAQQGTDYLAELDPSPLQHYWSLAVEEQFYLLWPLALVVAWRLGRRSVSSLLAACAVGCTVSFGLSVLLTPVRPPWAFFLLPTRAWELGVGALVALAAARLRPVLRATPVLALAGAVLVLGSAVVFDEHTPFPGAAAVVPVAGTALVLLAGTAVRRGPVALVLSTRPAQTLGELSYSIYLWHWPLLVLVEIRLAHHVSLWASLLLAAVSVPLAALTYRYVEQPARHARALVTRGPRVTVALAPVASVLAVVVAAAGATAAAARPLTGPSAADPPELAVTPVIPSSVPRNLVPDLRASAASLPAAYGDGCVVGYGDRAVTVCRYGDRGADRAVVLFGDSLAVMWLPALDVLARQHGMRLDLVAKSGCPPADVPSRFAGMTFPDCAVWRAAALEAIEATAPEVVVLSGSNGPSWDRKAAPAVWADGYRSVLHALDEVDRLVVIPPTPSFPVDPPVCASLHVRQLDRCAIDRSVAVDRAVEIASRRAADTTGATTFDVTDELCAPHRCGPVLGNLLLYRDDHHLTVEAARYLMPLLEDAIWR